MANIRNYYKCPICGTTYTVMDRFPKSQSKLYSGWDNHLPICKDCVPLLYNHYLEIYDDPLLVIRRICERYDIYYSSALANTAIEKSQKPMGYYISKSNSLPQYKDKSYQDTIDEEAVKVINSVEEAENDDECKIDPQTVRFFGAGFADEDYEYLKDQYDDWTTRHECKTKTQEEVFKRICFIQLDILKASRAKQSTKDLDKTLQDYLDAANLKPKQNNMDTLADAQTLGTLLAKWETERPLPEIDKDLRDVDKIGLYLDVFFKGHLAKMMGLKNGLSNLYSKFMKKYTVERPEYEGDENNEALFDAIFGNDAGDT